MGWIIFGGFFVAWSVAWFWLTSSVARHRSTAAAAERARIVAWLRTTCYGDPVEAKAFADMIEEGETE